MNISDSKKKLALAGIVCVLVTEPHQKMNVEKLAKDQGRKAVSSETEDGFAVVIG